MNYTYFDTETGGLFASKHALLSIGAVGPMNEVFFEHITPDSQPGKEVDPEAAKKNGYSREAWEELGARPLIDVLTDFAEWIRGSEADWGQTAIVAHNAAFDRSFLSEAERITGIPVMHRDRWRCTQVLMADMMDRGLIPAGSSRLDRLAELSGWPGLRHKRHEALQDALITQHGHRWLLEQQNKDRVARRHLENVILSISEYLDTPLDQPTTAPTSQFIRIVNEEARRIKAAGEHLANLSTPTHP